MKKLSWLLILVTLLSCKTEKDRFNDVDTENIKVNIQIERLERTLFKDKSENNIRKFVDQNAQMAGFFFRSPVQTDADKEILTRQITGLVANPALDSIYQASEKVFGDMEDIKGQFTEGFKHIKYYYPNFKEPKIKTIITGFSNDKLLSDTCMVIGIDFFLGKSINYTPPVFEYLKNRLTKPYFVHNIMLSISSKYIEIDPNDETLLSSMVGWGKALYFTRAVMPSAPDTIILGYSEKQLKSALAHEAEIFNHFIKGNLLYSVSHTNDKYVNERPYTAEIGSDCPPRIGRWLGYQIVSKYMEHNPKLKLSDLMKEKDVKKIFTQSKYKPKK